MVAQCKNCSQPWPTHMQFTSDIDLFELSRKYSYLQESFHSAMETSQRVVKKIVDRDNQQISTLLDGMERLVEILNNSYHVMQNFSNFASEYKVSFHLNIIREQECIPVGCVLPARYCTEGQTPPTEIPLDRDPQTETPQDRDTPPGQRSPGTETPTQEPPPPGQIPPPCEQNHRHV